MSKTKRNLDEEFEMIFPLYAEHWEYWSRAYRNAFTKKQLKLIEAYQITSDIKELAKKLKKPVRQLEEEFASVVDLLHSSLWRYYKTCERLYPDMRPIIEKHKSDLSFTKRHISKHGLNEKTVKKLEAAEIITPLHVIVEGRQRIRKLIGSYGYNEILRMFQYYGCDRYWN